MLSPDVRKKMWDFWHEQSQESTNTKNLVSIKISEKPKIQEGLTFVSTVTFV